MSSASNAFERLVAVMDKLREKCPWDQKQTIHTLRHLTIEETYELADSIDGNDWNGIREELGDILLHIVFYSRIGQEENVFTLTEVINDICEKLIRRHPHIYGKDNLAPELRAVTTDEDVKANWERLKLKEGKKSVLGGVPRSLPSMVKAIRLQEKTKAVGFEWENREQVWEKVKEETAELEEAIASGVQDRIEDETGDLLFSMINFARFLRVDADAALERTNKKFIRRFTALETAATEAGQSLAEMTLTEMDELWNQIKAGENAES